MSEKTPSIEESRQKLQSILDQKISKEDIILYLENMHQKGERVEEIVGFALEMKSRMQTIQLNSPLLLDCCGTGGSGKNRFNISTASAIILAQMGIPIAKHGNYGSKQKNGSFDFLEALNIPFNLSESETQAYFKTHNICFLLARHYHPYMKSLAPIREAIGHRTIFNLLGPLCNPAGATHQIIGTCDIQTGEKLAKACQKLGMFHTIVVVGGDGRDELSLSGQNILYTIKETEIKIEPYTNNQNPNMNYEAGNSEENARLFKTLLNQKNIDHPVIHHIALNAGLALQLTGKASSIDEGADQVLNAISAGKISARLN